jgi:hypothetical protein
MEGAVVTKKKWIDVCNNPVLTDDTPVIGLDSGIWV